MQPGLDAEIDQFFALADGDPDGAGDLDKEARAVAKEQAKLLSGLMDRRYQRRQDFAAFLEAGDNMGPLQAAINQGVQKVLGEGDVQRRLAREVGVHVHAGQAF